MNRAVTVLGMSTHEWRGKEAKVWDVPVFLGEAGRRLRISALPGVRKGLSGCLCQPKSRTHGGEGVKGTPQCPDYFSSQSMNKTGVRRKKYSK